MKVQDIIERLHVLGLDAEEAGVYVHLSIMGPSKASDVAAALKLHRTETYRTLQNLVQRGFATATLSRPARFEAAPPERLFNDILAAQQAKQENIQKAQGEIGEALASLRGTTEPEASKNTFKILQGRREIYAVVERMVREANAQLKCVSTHDGALAMAEMAGLIEVAVERAAQGVRVRTVLRADPSMRTKLQEIGDVPGLEFRAVSTDRIVRFVVMDERELLLWAVSDPSSRLAAAEDVAIWTDATDLVGTQSMLFDTLWRASSEARELPPAEHPPARDR